jgi:hypothetical protein
LIENIYSVSKEGKASCTYQFALVGSHTPHNRQLKSGAGIFDTKTLFVGHFVTRFLFLHLVIRGHIYKFYILDKCDVQDCIGGSIATL